MRRKPFLFFQNILTLAKKRIGAVFVLYSDKNYFKKTKHAFWTPDLVFSEKTLIVIRAYLHHALEASEYMLNI